MDERSISAEVASHRNGRRLRIPAILYAALLAVVMLAVPMGIAQRITGTLTGRVTDPTGAVISRATVTVINDDTQVTTVVQTTRDGNFVAPGLPPGRYSVIIQESGFKQLERHGIVLLVDQTLDINLVLSTGSVSETVVVTSQPSVLNTETSDTGAVIGNKEILNLPLNQRDPYSLVLLTPGVTGSTSEYFAGSRFNVNGGRQSTTDILLNGVSSTPPTDGGASELAVFPSVDAVEEFKVQTSNYSAEFGASGGGIINVVTKSGTEKIHGSAYDFLRNSYMDANNYFANHAGTPLASFKRNQFGATFGGPVFVPKLYDGRKKTFFFMSYEGLRQRSQSTTTQTVPTLAMREGDFTGLTNSAGTPITIYDPNTTTVTVNSSGTTYARSEFAQHNIIPKTRFNQVSQNVLKYFPLPTTSGSVNNFFASASAPSNTDQYDGRIDEIITPQHHLSFTFEVRQPYSGTAVYFPAAIAIAQDANSNTTHATNGTLDYTYAVSSTDLFEVRYGQTAINYKTLAQGDGFDPTQLGLPSYIAANASHLAFPGFEASGYISIGSGSVTYEGPSKWTTNTWSASNTKAFSRHTLKTGFETRFETNNTNQYGRSTGDFSFSKSLTQGPNPAVGTATAGDGFASFLLGVGTGTVTHNFKTVYTTSRYLAWFVQDDWKATTRLTVNLGLRYELYQPKTEKYNRMSWFAPSIASPLAAVTSLTNLQGGLEFPGVNGNPRTQSDIQYSNFAPRVGAVYHVANHLSARASWGIFYAASPNEAASTVAQFGYRTDSAYTGTSNNGITQVSISNPYPNGFVPVTGSALGALTSVGGGLTSVVRNEPTPYAEETSVDLQYELPKKWLVDVAYVGSRGLRLFYQRTANQLPDADLSMGAKLLNQVPNPFYGQSAIASGSESGATIQQNYLLTPFPQYTGVSLMLYPGAFSSYNSVQFQVQKQFDRNISVRFAYTGSKLMDDSSTSGLSNINGNGTSQDGNNIKSDYSISTADVPRNLVSAVVYRLPFGKDQIIGSSWNRLTDSVLGGWSLNTIFTLASGTPLSLSATNNNQNFGPGERPNWNGIDPKINGRVENRLSEYFNTTVFSQPASYTYGNMTRTIGALRSPRVTNLDASLFKDFSIREGLKSQLRLESFNVCNHPIFGGPGTSFTGTNFGVVSSQSNNPRQTQIALKLIF